MTNSEPTKGRLNARIGRPAVDDVRKLISIRVSQSEADELARAATVRGLPTTTWMRMVCLAAAKEIQ